jgi:hypothetical protein
MAVGAAVPMNTHDQTWAKEGVTLAHAYSAFALHVLWYFGSYGDFFYIRDEKLLQRIVGLLKLPPGIEGAYYFPILCLLSAPYDRFTKGSETFQSLLLQNDGPLSAIAGTLKTFSNSRRTNQVLFDKMTCVTLANFARGYLLQSSMVSGARGEFIIYLFRRYIGPLLVPGTPVDYDRIVLYLCFVINLSRSLIETKVCFDDDGFAELWLKLWSPEFQTPLIVELNFWLLCHLWLGDESTRGNQERYSDFDWRKAIVNTFQAHKDVLKVATRACRAFYVLFRMPGKELSNGLRKRRRNFLVEYPLKELILSSAAPDNMKSDLSVLMDKITTATT